MRFGIIPGRTATQPFQAIPAICLMAHCVPFSDKQALNLTIFSKLDAGCGGNSEKAVHS